MSGSTAPRCTASTAANSTRCTGPRAVAVLGLRPPGGVLRQPARGAGVTGTSDPQSTSDTAARARCPAGQNAGRARCRTGPSPPPAPGPSTVAKGAPRLPRRGFPPGNPPSWAPPPPLARPRYRVLARAAESPRGDTPPPTRVSCASWRTRSARGPWGRARAHHGPPVRPGRARPLLHGGDAVGPSRRPLKGAP